MRAERWTDAIADHGEGPVWWPEWGLRICDGYKGEIVSVDDAGRECGRIRVGSYVGAFRPRVAGGLVAGIERGFALVDDDGTVTRLAELWENVELRMNDGACDATGAFYCGSLREHEPREARGTLYRLADPAEPPTVVLTRQGVPNGLVVDGNVAFYIDTLTRVVRAFDVDDGVWTNPRVSLDLTSADSFPDGMTMDEAGRLWIAMWGDDRGAVHCYEPGGSEPQEAIAIPKANHVTAVTFGGPDRCDIFVTSSQQGTGAGEWAGSVFRAQTPVRGRLTLPYRY